MTYSSDFRRSVLLLATLVVFTGLGAKREAAKEGGAPSGLTVNGIAAPVDLDVTPRFGWHVNSAEQKAFEIRLSSTRSKAEASVHVDAFGRSWRGGSLDRFAR